MIFIFFIFIVIFYKMDPLVFPIRTILYYQYTLDYSACSNRKTQRSIHPSFYNDCENSEKKFN